MSAPDPFVREVHGIVRDLLVPDMRRYWVDFLITIAVCYAALATSLTSGNWSAGALAALVVSGLAMYRAIAFTHEIAHRRTGRFGTFAIAWNALCGVPFLVPSFLYGDHQGHHAAHEYGTPNDPEYLLLGGHSRPRMLLFLLLASVYPVLFAVRFLILTPLALMSRRIDRFTWTYTSSLYVMNEAYRRDYDARAQSASRWAQEVACSAWAWMCAALYASGRLPASAPLAIYSVFLFWIVINQVRTLTAHRYANDGASMSYLDQLLDSNTYPNGRILPELWAPLGLRYLALHHLMPSLPYHAMAEAHARLASRLPARSPYHQTIRPGLGTALIAMFASNESSDRAVRGRDDAPGRSASVPSTKV